MLAKLILITVLVQLGIELYAARYRHAKKHAWNEYGVIDVRPSRVGWLERTGYLAEHRKELSK